MWGSDVLSLQVNIGAFISRDQAQDPVLQSMDRGARWRASRPERPIMTLPFWLSMEAALSVRNRE